MTQAIAKPLPLRAPRKWRRVAAFAAVLVVACACALVVSPWLRFMAEWAGHKVLHTTGLRGPGKVTVDEPALRRGLAEQAGLAAPIDLNQTRIVVWKERRELELHQGERLLKSYPIALGRSPEGPKTRKGDRRTPEGDYTIFTRLDRTQFRLFMGLNYPNERDVQAGLAAGLIDEATADALKWEQTSDGVPAWNSPLGGAIGIHGGGVEFDWTDGCIAVETAMIDEIWAATRMGTPVRIEP